MRRTIALVVLAAALAGAGWHAAHLPPATQVLENGARLEWGDCWFEVAWSRPVHCGRFLTGAVPEEQGEPFTLPVVYVPARPWRRAATPLLYIAGGPGAATLLGPEDWSDWLVWLDEVDWPHDTVFYDQRGVGLSEPSYTCAELAQERRQLLPKNLGAHTAALRLQEAAIACRRRLEDAGVDLSRLHTLANARDARDLMATIGGAWDLYGVSYGTRIALQVMRMAPNRLRAVILDSTYPPQVHAERANPWLLDRVMGLVRRSCELLDSCSSASEVVAADLSAALARVRVQPLALEVPDPAGQGQLAVRMGEEDFAWLLFEAAYNWDRMMHLPGYVAAAARGKITPALRTLVADAVVNMFDTSTSEAVAAAVDCNDAPPWSRAQAVRIVRQYPFLEHLTADDWETHECRTWKTLDQGPAWRRPVNVQVPTLLLAGEFDPVTPPDWSEVTVRHLPNGQLFEFPQIGHGVLDSHHCAVALARAFLAAPSAPSAPGCLAEL